jgi:multiple sugar transport system substrate-binding protein/sn-glycerol 3-phosphate transport system substrate-binding protein
LAAAAVLFIAGCGPRPAGTGAKAAGAFAPIAPDAADLWDRQTTENADILEAIVKAFNAQNPGLPVKVVQSGNYGDIYRKTTAAIKARTLPSMAVAYGNMTVEYAREGAVADLGEFIRDPERGLAEADLGDFFPAVLEQNRYPQFGGAVLSWPYTKAVLVLYFNTRVMTAAGLSAPPATWDEFLGQCRVIKAKTGKHAICLDVDASTLDALIFSRGGEIVKDGRLSFSSPQTLAMLGMLETLFKEGLAYQNTPRTFSDQTAFGANETAFAFRPSSSLPYFKLVMEGNEGWGVARIPQSDPARPATVLYGANVSVFKTTAAHQAAAWAFLKYFTSPKVNAEWAVKTGYLPCRKSATEEPALQKFWAEWAYNRVAFDCLAFARSEPNVVGWQTIRSLLENAATEVVTGLKSPQAALDSLQAAVDAEYARH